MIDFIKGIFGVATFRAAAVSVANDLIERRRAYLKAIIANDSTQSKFKRNWMGRCDSLARLVAQYN